MLRRIFEANPLLCPKCNVEMKMVLVLTEPKVVNRVLCNVENIDGKSGEFLRIASCCKNYSSDHFR